jgi:hypothetical protein
MTRSEAQCEASMFPRTINVVTCIIATLVVSDPLAVTMHVRDLWVSLEIAEIALIASPLIRLALFGGTLLDLSLPLFRSPLLLNGGLPLLGCPLLRGLPGRRSRTTRWNISATNVTLVPMIAPAVLLLLATIPLLRNARNCKAHRE